MSKTLHLLKLYKELYENLVNTFTEKFCCGLLCVGKRNDSILRDIVDDINQRINATVIINDWVSNTNTKVIDPSKALTLHRLKLLGALAAQVRGYTVKPSLGYKLILSDTPERFQNKFHTLLVDGFWLLGRMIADSLSDDLDVNCGNPFDFQSGDLAFWWAGCVILDWVKNENSKHKKKSFLKCCDFYKDVSLSRKFKYYQNSGNSSFNHRLREDFLSEKDFEVFVQTIKNVRFAGHHFHELLNPMYFMENLEDHFKSLRMKVCE